MLVKGEKGVTLMALVIYIAAMLIILGILTSISSFFYGNIGIVKKSANYAAQFDIFNAYMTVDVKNNSDVIVNGNTIIFEDGTTYVYNDEGIYRGNQRVATNVKSFTVTKRTVTVENVDKSVLRIKIIIGNSEKTLFNKTIDYTLKYW